jgi:hypothetical protein
MQIELSAPEVSLVMAALRAWQDMTAAFKLEDEYEAYFEAHEPLNSGEIDALCARIAEAALRTGRG